MYLLYINALNKNHRGESIYEFIFGDTTEIEYGDNWDAVPASASEVTPPPLEYIKLVGLLVTDQMELETIQESDYFAVIDAVDDIVALAWEKYPTEGRIRMVFHYGETFESVKDKLYAVDLELDMERTAKYATTYEKD
ncbi:MAG: hypothetical protein WC341_08055 [Bacteroidales bacterium]|jgi:hypothetical protein